MGSPVRFFADLLTWQRVYVREEVEVTYVRT